MRIKHPIIFGILVIIIGFSSCESQDSKQEEVINNPYLSVQEEIKKVILSIVKDAEEANIEGLKSAHLKSEKFSKFGPRNFNRQNVTGTNKTEEAFFSSILNYKQEVRELKIDVFDDVAIATYYPHVSFILNGEEITGSGRQTFVFLSTEEGWKLVHEHSTPRPQ